MLAEDEEVDEVNDQLAEDDGKLIPRHKSATDIGWLHLGNIHWADG